VAIRQQPDGGPQQPVLSLGAVREATGPAAVRAFVEANVLPGSGWSLESISQRSVRLEPPWSYWAVYRVRVEREGERRDLRLVARAAFDEAAWVDYRDGSLAPHLGRPCDPLRGVGYPVAYDETQHAFWFYPFDPALPSLPAVADPSRMLRFFRERKQLLARPGRVSRVDVERVRYLPEQSAILRYTPLTEPAAAARAVYGKVEPGGRGERVDEFMRELWRLAAGSGGTLRVPEPLGFDRDLGLFLQEEVDGEAVGGDRTAPEFAAAAEAAAGALATIHDARLPATDELAIDDDIAQLDGVLDQFALVDPDAFRLLRQLLSHVRARLGRTPPEERVPTHGDFKYDQLLHHEGRFTVIDFEFFGVGETSYDLARFCAHLVPSRPRSFEDSAAGEDARTRFLARYRELRPEAALHRFPIYEAVDLATRSMVMMWSQDEGWQAAAEALLVLAMERLQEEAP